MHFRCIVGAVLVSTMLAACMSTGVKVDPQQVASFRAGVTTKQEVESRLGSPTVQSMLPDGTSILVYSFTSAQARPASFIPLIGMFAGGADVKSQSVSFQFGPDGILKGSTSTAAQSGSQMGTTTSTPMQTDQPRQVQ